MDRLCGDTKQDDLSSTRYNEVSGLKDMMKVFERMGLMSTVQFGIDDIVRSGFVKSFIIAEYELGLY
jgi:phosphate starvation-inducible protein PhoH